MKFNLYRLLFIIVSLLADIMKGASLFVKYKIAIGIVILGISGVSCIQKTSANSSIIQSNLIDITDSIKYIDDVDTAVIYISIDTSSLKKEDTIASTQVYKYAEIDVFPVSPEGDLDSFVVWVQKNIMYTETMFHNKIEGRVVVSFVIDKQGNLVDIKILRGLCKEADDETIRVLSLSKSWIPGELKGHKVDTEIFIHVLFKSNESL